MKRSSPTEDTPTPEGKEDWYDPHAADHSLKKPKQDDNQQLREAIEKIRDIYETEGKTVQNGDQAREVITAFQDNIIHLFHKEQLQLVSELKQGSSQHSPTPTAQGHEADNLSPKAHAAAMDVLGNFHEFSNIAWSDVTDGVHTVGEYAQFYEQARRKAIKDILMIAKADAKGNDMITPDSSQDTVTPSRPVQHKKQELERGK